MAATSTGPDRRGTATGRRTQAERSRATRSLLLDATIECLIDVGYSATSTTAIAHHAGVSRGAQLHHYPTKAGLVAAAVEQLANRMSAELSRRLARLRGSGHEVTAVVDVLWASYQSPLFDAWLELATAARTDPELRAQLGPVEVRARAAVERMVLGMLGGEAGNDGAVGELVALTLHVLQGLALERSVLTESRRARSRRETRALATWKAIIADQLDDRR